jgi:ABC-type dipeptide/oligopeptide/nickel transport system permease subunit
VFASLVIGLFLGLLSTWGGKGTEKFLLLLTDIVMAYPGIVLAIVLSALTGGGSAAVLLALIFTGWPSYFRMSRSLLKGLLERPFVESAILAGFPLPVIIWKYILPELTSTLGVMVSLGCGKTILEISSLGFLGIGLAPPEPELGRMISESLSYMRSAPRTIFLPGGLISLLVLSFLLLGQEKTDRKGEINS